LPAETVLRLRELDHAVWTRGNTERLLVEPLPEDEPMAAAVQACRDDLGDAVADELGALPENAPIDATTVPCHGSPVSDMQSFPAEPSRARTRPSCSRARPPEVRADRLLHSLYVKRSVRRGAHGPP
jgi:hypothetical protein